MDITSTVRVLSLVAANYKMYVQMYMYMTFQTSDDLEADIQIQKPYKMLYLQRR